MNKKELFYKLENGKEIYSFTIKSGNLILEVIEYGARIKLLKTIDKNGKLIDVVVSLKNFNEYEKDTRFLGATIGRYANRISNAAFELNNQKYFLTKNEGENQLHGGNGFDKKIWKGEFIENGIKMTYFSLDKEEGFPGNLNVQVCFILKDNGLSIEYFAKSDRDTVINLTNHSYFNLHGEGIVAETEIEINSLYITESDENLIPTGNLLCIVGSEFDFTKPKILNDNFFDVNYVLNKENFGFAARAYSPKSGITMECYTDQPGMQFYTGYKYGFCFETQHFPDSPNNKHFPSVILKGGQTFLSNTLYKFKTE